MIDPNKAKKELAASKRKIAFLLERHNATKIEDINSHTDREVAEIHQRLILKSENGNDQ